MSSGLFAFVQYLYAVEHYFNHDLCAVEHYCNQYSCAVEHYLNHELCAVEHYNYYHLSKLCYHFYLSSVYYYPLEIKLDTLDTRIDPDLPASPDSLE